MSQGTRLGLNVLRHQNSPQHTYSFGIFFFFTPNIVVQLYKKAAVFIIKCINNLYIIQKVFHGHGNVFAIFLNIPFKYFLKLDNVSPPAWCNSGTVKT